MTGVLAEVCKAVRLLFAVFGLLSANLYLKDLRSLWEPRTSFTWMKWILMSVAESFTHKEGRRSWVMVVTNPPLSLALGVSQSINNPARPTSHRLAARAWSYHPGRGPIDGCGQLDCANVGWIKSRPSRILRPVPRRRAIVAPRFGKWARVLETSMERKPTRRDQLPRLSFSGPL